MTVIQEMHLEDIEGNEKKRWNLCVRWLLMAGAKNLTISWTSVILVV